MFSILFSVVQGYKCFLVSLNVEFVFVFHGVLYHFLRKVTWKLFETKAPLPSLFPLVQSVCGTYRCTTAFLEGHQRPHFAKSRVVFLPVLLERGGTAWFTSCSQLKTLFSLLQWRQALLVFLLCPGSPSQVTSLASPTRSIHRMNPKFSSPFCSSRTLAVT